MKEEGAVLTKTCPNNNSYKTMLEQRSRSKVRLLRTKKNSKNTVMALGFERKLLVLPKKREKEESYTSNNNSLNITMTSNTTEVQVLANHHLEGLSICKMV